MDIKVNGKKISVRGFADTKRKGLAVASFITMRRFLPSLTYLPRGTRVYVNGELLKLGMVIGNWNNKEGTHEECLYIFDRGNKNELNHEC